MSATAANTYRSLPGCGTAACVCMQVLDIPRTLEFLETQGVCVTCYGTDEFPAFFSRSSGCRAPCRVDTPAQ